MSRYRHLVALGSSFAAGPGIPPRIDRAANRSGNNYAHLLARRLDSDLTDLTVSGATTATILDVPQRSIGRRPIPPQISGVPAAADLATITVGGNDLGYARGLILRALAASLRRRAVTRGAGSALRRRVPLRPPSAVDVERATAGLVDVAAAVRAVAPGVRVVLVDYLTVLGAESTPGHGVSFDAPEIEYFRAVAEQLDQAFAEAARRSGADLLRASVLSREHGIGSPQPWVTGFRPSLRPVPFHPNLQGMAAVTAEILRLLDD